MGSRTQIALAVALFAVTISAVSAQAQIMGGRGQAQAQTRPVQARSDHPAQGRRMAPPFTPARGNGRRGERRGIGNGLFFYPDYYWDGGYESYAQEAPEQPPVQQVVIQQPQEAPQAPAKPIEPLVLEERDGQWMRVPIGSQVPVESQSRQPRVATSARVQEPSPGGTSLAERPAELPPVVLVFRDGHREEMNNYLIQGDALYTSADRWSTGAWSRKIPIAELDVAASLRVNAERGAKFSLPRGPNQVVVRF